MSLRKLAPALAQRLDLALEVDDLDLDAIPAPGLGRTAMGIGCPAPLTPGRLSSSRKSPRESIAKPGPGRISTLKPSCST
jgi:hypothetical protein